MRVNYLSLIQLSHPVCDKATTLRSYYYTCWLLESILHYTDNVTTNMLMWYHCKRALSGLYNILDHHLIFSWQSEVLLLLQLLVLTVQFFSTKLHQNSSQSFHNQRRYVPSVNVNYWHKSKIHCVHEKRDQNVFCNISYKTQAILMKSGTPFPE